MKDSKLESKNLAVDGLSAAGFPSYDVNDAKDVSMIEQAQAMSRIFGITVRMLKRASDHDTIKKLSKL